MINIISKEIHIEEDIKREIEFICLFCNTTPTFINGSAKNFEHTNLSYIEPYRIIIKGINYSKNLYVGKLQNNIKFNELEGLINHLINSSFLSNINVSNIAKKYVH